MQQLIYIIAFCIGAACEKDASNVEVGFYESRSVCESRMEDMRAAEPIIEFVSECDRAYTITQTEFDSQDKLLLHLQSASMVKM